ncbi:polysaccharide biosynthesis tyrosine autokinase [Polymorphum gilvum]|uniref:non-specific protein-tyrosine kinase n=1 Tax=Polymorphum gilvum (strain LMG 25793 / CGMCC 1.9160 / SL003B-26A1) TaxID=991905 RepID=F2IW62_POLGS|nr:polysaccharide biosynthesis tyrosine autokinase [Polymorphum gilvum]ADZ71447.1 Exopolysaccharide transport protein family [Polymorphum gilvum SL003B-26A1]
MLNRPVGSPSFPPSRSYEAQSEPLDELTIDLDRLLGAAKRQVRVILAACGIGLLLGVGYLLTSQPLYTATTQLLIDDQQVRFGETESGLNVRFDAAKIDSQVELIKSERIALSVIDKLGLMDDPAFMESGASILGKGVGAIKALFDFNRWLGIETELSEDEKLARQRQALAIIEDNLQVSRSGLTYVLSISYTAPVPRDAARIANAFGEAYLLDQLEAKYDATRRASTWLQSRIQELKEQSLTTDLAVQRFRAENNLIMADGTLLGDQQLADMNSQLILARAATAQAEAKYSRIADIITRGQMDAAVTEALNNPVIADLRSKYLEASKRYAEISQNLGASHIQAVKFRNDMTEYQKVIFDELGRIAESYQSELAIARSREKSIQDSLATMVGESAGTNETLVALRELEREAETYRNLYQTFMQRYQETVQQQSFPVTEARIITEAMPPEKPSHPRKALVLALSLVLGGMAGVGAGALREFRDRGFRTGEQVRERLGLEFLGLLPILPHRILKPSGNLTAGGNTTRFIQPTDAVMRQTLDAPLSGFSETLRAAKIAADLMVGDKKVKILGTVSIFPGEGKSTVSKNFASLLANLGARTLLIDCDLRNPGLTRSVAAKAESGLMEVLLDEQSLKGALLVEPDSKLFVLPAVVKQRISHTSELLASPAMRKLLKDASESFDYIIVDLPPLAPVVDVRAITDQIDAFLLVVEWGKTARQTVRATLAHDERLREKCLGVVLNKVDTQAQKMYEKYNSEGYQYSAYSRYYSE